MAKRNSTVTIHYHHLCKKEEYKTLAIQHFTEVMERETSLARPLTVVDFAKVKSYAPKLYHCCADIELKPISYARDSG